jgi:transposase-like protein
MAIPIKCPFCKASLRVRDEYGGKRIKCPRCDNVLRIPAIEETMREELPEAPRRKPSLSGAIQTSPRNPGGVATKMQPCPSCGKRIPVDARKCRYCKQWVEDEEVVQDENAAEDQDSPYVNCPRCRAKKPRKVLWTMWGSFYGPAMFSHVRCRKCGYAYNGRTGSSNLPWAILFVAVPAFLIILILIGIILIFKKQGYFDSEPQRPGKRAAVSLVRSWEVPRTANWHRTTLAGPSESP